MACPAVPALVESASPAAILSKSVRNFASYQHPVVAEALQAQSELPLKRDVIWSAGVLLCSLGILVLSFFGDVVTRLIRSRAVSELMQIGGFYDVDEGLLVLTVRTLLGLLSLVHSASLYHFIKLHTSASTFTAPPLPKTPAPKHYKAPLLSADQVALLFPSAVSQSAKALSSLSNTVHSVSETPEQVSQLASSVLKKTKGVLHDVSDQFETPERRSELASAMLKKTKIVLHNVSDSLKLHKSATPSLPPTESAPPKQPPPEKPALLAPIHPEIQRPTGVALWGGGAKVMTDVKLPGELAKTPPAFGQDAFLSPPQLQAASQVQAASGGLERERKFRSLQSQEDLDDFLADLDRRMETPKPQSPYLSTPLDACKSLDAGYQSPVSPKALPPVGAAFSPSYDAPQSFRPETQGQTPPPFQSTPNQPPPIRPQSSPYSPPSPAPYAPSAPPMPGIDTASPSPYGASPPGISAASPSPYGASPSSYGAFQQPGPVSQQLQTPSPYATGAPAYASPTPPAYSPYSQTLGTSPQSNTAYPTTPPTAYAPSVNPSPYAASPDQAPQAISPFLGGQLDPASSPLPGGRPFIRSSPSQPKAGTPAGVKTDRELPGPMPPEVFQRRLKSIGVSARDLDEWRDELRLWFAERLLGPLVRKINESPDKVQRTAAALSITLPVTPSPLDTDSKAADAALTMQAAPSEEQVLKMLGEKLGEEKKKAMQPKPQTTPMFGLTQSQQQGPSLPVIQACLDAVTKNQRLRLLLRGELVSNILPFPSVPPAFIAGRIRELAEGACVKRYDWSGGGDVIPGQQPWAPGLGLPGDAHLLFYLFTAFLEFPGWTLHQEPSTGPGHQGGFFFVGDIPKRLPEHFVAILQPPLTAELRVAIRQPKATVVLVGKQSPAPAFYLLWEGKFQFVLQTRTAIWDAVALLTLRVRKSHGGAIRGVSLSSSSMELLPSILSLPARVPSLYDP